MKALVYEGIEQLTLRDLPDPSLEDDTILIGVKYAFICATDIKTVKQGHPLIEPPTVIGHEFSGVVERIGKDVTMVKPGDCVTAIPYVNCGECEQCIRGYHEACTNREFPSNGAFSKYVGVSEGYARKGLEIIGEGLLKEAALSEPVACVLNSSRNFGPKPGDSVLVVGAGFMGLLNALFLKCAYGVRSLITDINEDRLVLPGTLGIEVLQSDEAVRNTYDAVVLTPPITELILQYGPCVAPFGHLVLFGGYPKGSTAEFDPNLAHYKGVKIVGTSGFSPLDFKRAVKLISRKVIPLSPFVDDIYDFEDFSKAFSDVTSGKVLKAALRWAGGKDKHVR